MKISLLIKELQKELEAKGDIEVTLTATTWPDGFSTDNTVPDVFESTVETLHYGKDKKFGKHIRLYF